MDHFLVLELLPSFPLSSLVKNIGLKELPIFPLKGAEHADPGDSSAPTGFFLSFLLPSVILTFFFFLLPFPFFPSPRPRHRKEGPPPHTCSMPPRSSLTSSFSVTDANNEVVCPLKNNDGSNCRKRCLGVSDSFQPPLCLSESPTLLSPSAWEQPRETGEKKKDGG